MSFYQTLFIIINTAKQFSTQEAFDAKIIKIDVFLIRKREREMLKEISYIQIYYILVFVTNQNHLELFFFNTDLL